jgi:hypothetical protein
VVAERPRHAPQKGQVALEDALAELIEPQSSDAISGSSSSGCSRSSRTDRPPALPQERLMIASQPASRRPSVRSRNAARSCVGVPSASRAWRWSTAAPACHAASADAMIASLLSGTFGRRCGSGSLEPVIAHWTTSGV